MPATTKSLSYLLEAASQHAFIPVERCTEVLLVHDRGITYLSAGQIICEFRTTDI